MKKPRRPKPESKFKKGDFVYYNDDSDWHGYIVRMEDLDGDGVLFAVVQWDTGGETDGIGEDEIGHLPVIESLARLARFGNRGRTKHGRRRSGK